MLYTTADNRPSFIAFWLTDFIHSDLAKPYR